MPDCNIKTLYAIGDSLVWGSEIGVTPEEAYYEDTHMIFSDYKKKYVYSSILASHFNIPNYINAAYPGSSNERSYRVLITDVAKLLETHAPYEIFVLVGLTSETRREFSRSDGKDYYRHMDSHKPESRYYPSDAELWKVLTEHFSNEEGQHVFDTMITLAIQNFLKVMGIPYLITTSMRSADIQQAKYIKYIPSNLHNLLLSNARYHHTPSFSSFVMSQHFPVGEGYHPLEEGHLAWAEYLKTLILTNNFLSVP
jgi:hypothetical protein